jgi:hypothetical protein
MLFGSSALFAQKSIEQSGIKITTAPLHCDVPSEGYQADLIALTITNITNEVKTLSISATSSSLTYSHQTTMATTTTSKCCFTAA